MILGIGILYIMNTAIFGDLSYMQYQIKLICTKLQVFFSRTLE